MFKSKSLNLEFFVLIVIFSVFLYFIIFVLFSGFYFIIPFGKRIINHHAIILPTKMNNDFLILHNSLFIVRFPSCLKDVFTRHIFEGHTYGDIRLVFGELVPK